MQITLGSYKYTSAYLFMAHEYNNSICYRSKRLWRESTLWRDNLPYVCESHIKRRVFWWEKLVS